MEDEPFICQLAFCVTDMLADVHFFLRGLGYRSMGGRYLAGEPLTTLQELDDPVCQLWWLSGAQPFFQLEFFHYLRPGDPPAKSPRTAGYSAATFAVPSLDEAAAVAAAGGSPETKVSSVGVRYLSLDAPSGAVIEIVEDSTVTLPARLRGIRARVTNLEAAAAFFVDVFGFVRVASESATARLNAGEVTLELERIETPEGEEADRRPSLDTPGIQNFAIGYTDKSRFIDTYERLRAGGYWTSNPPDLQRPVEAVDYFYSRGPDGLSVEVLYCPVAMRGALGFAS